MAADPRVSAPPWLGWRSKSRTILKSAISVFLSYVDTYQTILQVLVNIHIWTICTIYK